MLDLTQINRGRLQSRPYAWAHIRDLFSPRDGATLAASFPCDHFKTVAARDAHRSYDYEARGLIGLGAESLTYPDELSRAWRELALRLVSPEYRAAMSLLVERDLTAVPVEVNAFHYGPRAHLSPHPDLPDKIATHVIYFNRAWEPDVGGCLRILGSSNEADVAAEVAPTVGDSAVIVRSAASWHAVSPVADGCELSRRSVTVTFYHPGAVSSMWPPGDSVPLHRCGVSGRTDR